MCRYFIVQTILDGYSRDGIIKTAVQGRNAVLAFMGPPPAYSPPRPEEPKKPKIPRMSPLPLQKGTVGERTWFATIILLVLVTSPLWIPLLIICRVIKL